MTTNDVQKQLGDPPPLDHWYSLSDEEMTADLTTRCTAMVKRSLTEPEHGRVRSIVTARRLITASFTPRIAATAAIALATCLCAFAFGFGLRRRTDEWRYGKVWYGKLPPEGSGITLTAVPEQYHPHDHYCGGSNDDNASVVNDLKQRHPGLEIRGQIEVIESLRSRFGLGIPDYHASLPGLDYLNTQGVVEQQLLTGLGEHRVVLVTSICDHVARCAATLGACMSRSRTSPVTVLIPPVGGIHYHKDSTQKWTRRPEDFRPHEVMARIKSIFYGTFTVADLARHLVEDAA